MIRLGLIKKNVMDGTRSMRGTEEEHAQVFGRKHWTEKNGWKI